MPTLKFQQASSDPTFYSASQQLLWLDFHTKIGSLINSFELVLRTPVDKYIALLSLCDGRVESAGANVLGSERLKFSYSAQRIAGHYDRLVVSLKKPLVNVGRFNLSGENSAEDRLRLRFVVTSHIVDVVNQTVIQANSSLFVKAYVNFTKTLRWGGVSLWNYSTSQNVSSAL